MDGLESSEFISSRAGALGCLPKKVREVPLGRVFCFGACGDMEAGCLAVQWLCRRGACR